MVDAKLHEDAVHRGSAQVLPAIRKAIYGAIMLADPCLLEPVQNVFISAPSRYMGECSREIQNRLGIITNQSLTGDMVDIKSEVQVAEMFGFAGDIRSATSGTCLWSAEMLGFKLLPANLKDDIVCEIRKRKGLSAKPYNAQHYLE